MLDLFKKNQKFIVLFFLFLLLLVYLLKSSFYGRRPAQFPLAPVKGLPQKVKISNLSDNSLSVSWVTNDPVSGAISYWQENEQMQTIDQKEQSGKTLHYFTLSELQPETTYFFSIISDANAFNNQGSPYKIKTAPITKKPPAAPFLIRGKILDENQTPVNQALIFFKTDNSTLISTAGNNEGNFVLALNNSRFSDLKDYFLPKTGSLGEISIETGPKGSLQKEITIKENLNLNLALQKSTIEEVEQLAASPEKNLWQKLKDWFNKIF